MVSTYLALCGAMSPLGKLVLAGDFAIAGAYFAIPVGMIVIFRRRLRDLPYPWLFLLFAAFIVACGLTHVIHAIQMPWTTFEHTIPEAAVKTIAAVLSVTTAAALLSLLPQIKLLPSPAEQQAALERELTKRSREKDDLVWEIYHQLGNQLQVFSSALNIESRTSVNDEQKKSIARLMQITDGLRKRQTALLARANDAHIASRLPGGF